MNEIDTEKIKKITNTLIGYKNYEKEIEMKNKKLKKLTFTFLALFIVIGGTITVDAATDNAISNIIKDMITVKVDGEEKNATCKQLENGYTSCTLDNDMTFQFNESLTKNPNIEVNHYKNEEGEEVSLTFNDVNNVSTSLTGTSEN